jgi:protein-S-isoprenylcysteine O-methyltransferase Ste14
MKATAFSKISARVLLGFSVISLLYAVFPIIVAGRWNWWQGWAYAVVTLLTAFLSRVLLALRHPDLMTERGKGLNVAGTKPWDKALAPLVGMVGPLAALVVCGLDARFRWSPELPLWLEIAALAVLILGDVFASWALIENRFFAGTVRIQTERGHHVVDTGPYRYVRHPGYAASLWSFLASVVLLGSLWGLVPALFTAAALVVRTALEDRTLQVELPGYKEYAQKTRYRLLPGVW